MYLSDGPSPIVSNESERGAIVEMSRKWAKYDEFVEYFWTITGLRLRVTIVENVAQVRKKNSNIFSFGT